MRRFSARIASFVVFPSASFFLVVVPAFAGVAELADRGDVKDMVELAVPSRVEPMPYLLSPEEASMGALAL